MFYEALKVALRRIMALEGPPKAFEHGRALRAFRVLFRIINAMLMV